MKRVAVRRWLKRGIIVAGIIAVLVAIVMVVLWYSFPFPSARIEEWPESVTVTTRDGRPMLRRVGSDDQWRTPVTLDAMSPWLPLATVAVEDQRFHSHGGVDALAVGRALLQNVESGRVVSGASTISMQVCRMTEPRPRTFRTKAIEAFRSLQLESLYTKEQILETYLNVAPYGGNLRGVEAASRHYFSKPSSALSLPEAALLAGLPQSPSHLRPDRFPERAHARRETVLGRMVELGMISDEERCLASAEPIATAVASPPAPIAGHAGWMALADQPTGGTTTIDGMLQRRYERLVRDHAATLPARTQIAVVAIDIARNEVAALIGSANPQDPRDGSVNGALAWRSSGSTLKPFIYAAAFDERRLAPDSVVHDIPVERGGWRPRNFDGGFRGPLSAADALRLSRNVPALLVLEAVGVARCRGVMEGAGLRFLQQSVARSGLALATGGEEVRLIDLVNAYATVGRGGVPKSPRLVPSRADEPNVHETPVLDRRTCTALDEVLSSWRRPPNGSADQRPEDRPWFMWKTGTSSGRRDAWAVGHNRRYAIGVWVGRFDGRGNPRYVGGECAEPLLAGLFADDRVRVETAPAAPQKWTVSWPLPKPRELGHDLSILVPGNRSTFIATDGCAILRPRANRPRNVVWFLDGRLLEESEAERLVLGPGRYELRCADGGGNASAVTFSVRSTSAARLPYGRTNLARRSRAVGVAR